MPSGEYLLTDPHDGTVVGVERFRSAPGPVGWRYVATRHSRDGAETARLDLAVDSRGRPARLEVAAGGWVLRGGSSGRDVLWVRRAADGSGDPQEGSAEAAGFTGNSPAFLVVASRCATESGTSMRLAAVSLPSLAATMVSHRWTSSGSRHYEAEGIALDVRSFTVVDLDTGLGGEVHVADDVVVAAPGVELTALEF